MTTKLRKEVYSLYYSLSFSWYFYTLNICGCGELKFYIFFSMYPLLLRDGQAVSYFALLAIFLVASMFLVDVKSHSKWLKSCVSLLFLSDERCEGCLDCFYIFWLSTLHSGKLCRTNYPSSIIYQNLCVLLDNVWFEG